jgi:hypothetical protein
MEEILKKLLEAEILSEDTKQDLTEAWQEAVKAKTAELREEAMLEVRAELADQWVKEREALVTKLDAFVSEQLETEFNELRSDIESFRDLEAEYAGKLVSEKQKISEQMTQELDILVDKIDAFFEQRLTEELEELREDLQVVRENEFGRKLFEAFVNEYAKSYVDEDAIQSKLTITESKLQDVQKRLQEMEKEKEVLLREQKMEELLKPLSGSKREQMQFVLQNIETKKLDEAYNHFINRVLKEDVKQEEKKLVESKKEDVKMTTVKTGDVEPEVITESKHSSDLATLKRLAGIA